MNRLSANRRLLLIPLVAIPALWLSSCSGAKVTVCTGTCVNNNGVVSLVLTATPPAPNSQLSVLAFSTTITGIALQAGSGLSPSVNVPLNATTYIAEFNRVTSDSTILAAGDAIPAGTYTQMKVTFSAPTVTFCAQPNSGVPGCAAGTLKSVTGAAGSATVSVNLSLSANQKAGFVINVNLGNTLTLNGQNIIAVNLGANNVFTAAALPPASGKTDLAAGQLSHLDDVMGTVASINGSTITLQTSTRGSVTATANSSTQFATSCASPSVSGCIHVNDVAIVDAILNTDGTVTLVFYQPLFMGSRDLIEGVVTGVPDSVANTLTVAVTDSVFANSGSMLSSQLHIGDQIRVTLAAPAQPFSIVGKNLNVPANSFSSSTSISNVQPGQTVAFPVGTFIAQSGVTPGTTTTNTFLLRFTRISGIVGAAAIPSFSGNTLPPFFGISTPEQFQTTSGRLSLDGIADLGSLQTGNTFSTSALYLGSPANPLFAAQTVRAH